MVRALKCLCGQCKTCYAREYKRRQRQDPVAYAAMLEANRRWQQSHPAYERERAKRRWQDPLCRAYHSSHRKANPPTPEQSAQYRRTKRAKNPEQWVLDVRSYVQSRKARKRGAKVCDFTAAQWARLKVEFNHRCFYCNETNPALTQDHMVPLSRGGDHTQSNIVPACSTCNGRKGTKTAEEFICQ